MNSSAATRNRRTITRPLLAAVVALAPAAVPLSAQPGATLPATGVVTGRVLRAPEGVPIAGATLRIANRRAVSASNGTFVLDSVPTGEVDLLAEAAGLAPRTLSLVVTANDTLQIFVRLAQRAVQLDQVVVTAVEKQRSAEGSSVSRIERDAIDHVQASSLADVLQLVPGQPALNPSLSAPRQSLLRQAPTQSARDPGPGGDAQRSNALGTSVVLDGVPMSNNANLQSTVTILNSGPSTLPPFASTAGRGLDLRQVPADQIESVEVIRGVPSARHGDLTAGAILVTTRVTAQRPELRIRANPLAIEMTSIGGWRSAAGNGLAVDANLVRSQDDPRSTLDRFTRYNIGVALGSRPTATVPVTLRIRASGILDEAQRDPDDFRYQRETWSRDAALRGDFNARVGSATTGWRAELVSSLNLATQQSRHQELVTRDIFPLTSARRDTLAPGVFGRSEYLGELEVHGRPVNGYGRLEIRYTGSQRGWRATTLSGAELRYDANHGSGRLFDAIRPPRQNYGVGDRPDDFSSVRAQTQLAPYLEQRIQGSLARRPFDASIGVRLDAIDPGSNTASVTLSPRVATMWRVSNALAVRGAYGTTVKAPTLSQRYPLARYFDLVSFNHYPQNPDERLVMFTTRVVDTRPADLAPVRATKSEGGVDWWWKQASGTFTLFAERTVGAFGTTRLPIGIQVPILRATEFPTGRPPVLDSVPLRTDWFVGLYDRPQNSRRISSRGVEATADFPEWRTLRTAFSFGGAWFDTRAIDIDIDIPVEQFISGTTQPQRVGVYESGRGSQADRLLTTLRTVHRVPRIGLAATIIFQTIWWENDRPLGRLDGLPIGYLDRTGSLTRLSRSEAQDSVFASLRRDVLPMSVRWERRPPLHLVNLRLTKALPGGSQMAVFANNALASLPLYRRQRQVGFERRNQPQFFGVEFLTSLGLR